MWTSDFWLEVGGPLGSGGLVHRSSCDAAPRFGGFSIGGFTASRDAVSAARDYVASVSLCPRCCPSRRWTAPRRRPAPGNPGVKSVEDFLADPWRRETG